MSRVVLNSDKDLKNVVSKDDLADVTIKTLSELVQQLLSISGPTSRNSFILYNNSTLNDGLNTDITGGCSGVEAFTRDGIHCLSNISYMSTIQRYIKDKLLAFMGRRIDACCGDGTTSSMIFTASFVVYLLKERHKLDDWSITDLEKNFKIFTKLLVEELDNKKITIDTLTTLQNENSEPKFTRQSAAKFLAYLQAYTASAGNQQVAEAVSEIFANMPEEVWQTAISQKYPYRETDECAVKAVQSAYHARYSVDIITPELCNVDLGRAFERKNANILVLRTGIVRDSLTTIALQTYLAQQIDKAEQEKTKPEGLVVLFPSQSNGHDSDFCSAMCDLCRKSGLELFVAQYQKPIGYGTEFMYSMDALSAKANVPPYTNNTVCESDFISAERFIIKGDIKVDFHECYIDNVVPYLDCCTEEDKLSNVHPGEKYPEAYKYYTDWKAFFNDALEKEQAVGERGNETVIKDLNKALIIMKVKRDWYLTVGGKQHDQQMLEHVLDDASKSALAAVNHGIFLNGPQKLYSAVRLVYSQLICGRSGVSRPTSNCCEVYASCFFQAARDLCYAIFGSLANKIEPNDDFMDNVGSRQFGYYDFYHIASKGPRPFNAFSYINPDAAITHCLGIPELPELQDFRTLTDVVASEGGYTKLAEQLESGMLIAPPAQVGNLFDVLFDRLREVALRFGLIDNLIAIGTVWDTNQNKQA